MDDPSIDAFTSDCVRRDAMLLLTPGPLTTSGATRAALDRDWGSRHGDFLALSERVRARLVRLAGAEQTHVAVPIQGSGTFAVEAAITTLVPRAGKLLIAVNGAYGARAAAIARRAGRSHTVLEWPETEAVDPSAIADALRQDPSLTDVALVHCETSSGLLNPLEAVGAIVAGMGRRLHVDAMSSFGAIPIDLGSAPFTSLSASSNKGLEGVPGVSFVIAERSHLGECADQASTLSLDLHAQHRGFERNAGQWRFTPPVQVVAALDRALDLLEAEGGVAARHARYELNRRVLVEGMRGLGYETLLEDRLQSAVIVTFRSPPDLRFETFYEALAEQGLVIYPGKLAQAESFRIGCIGQVFASDMRRVVAAVAATSGGAGQHVVHPVQAG